MSTTAAKRKQEDRLTQTLRELASQPANKQCFDCSQRGPTYVNMTVGSFCCTGCSGILRGLNPPHRVKSISMATFTPEEVEFVKNRGNLFCRKVWMGLHDSDKPFAIENGFKDETQMKDHLIQKYEKKRWFVSPTEVARQQAILDKVQHSSGTDREPTSPIAAAPQSVSNGSKGQISRPQPSSVSTPISLIDTSSPKISNSHHQQQIFMGSSGPTGLSASVSVGKVAQNDSFADFAAAFNGGISPPVNVAPIHQSSNFVPKSQTVPINLHQQNHFGLSVNSSTLMPTTRDTAVSQPHVSQPVVQQSAGDKYSALADLDEMFKVVTTPSTTHSAPVKVPPAEVKSVDQTAVVNPFAGQQHLGGFAPPPTTSHQQWPVGAAAQQQQFGYRPPGPNPFANVPPQQQYGHHQQQPNPFGGQQQHQQQMRLPQQTYPHAQNVVGWGQQGVFPQQFGTPVQPQMFSQSVGQQPSMDGKSWNPFL